MDSNQMADELELRLDRSDSFGSPGYEDFELSSVLTEAQMLYVKEFISELNNRKQEGFDETEIRKQGLSALLKRGIQLLISPSQTGVLENETFYDLPADFMYCVYESVTIDKNICNTQTPISNITVKSIAYNEINRLSKNKYKRPYYKDYNDGVVWRIEYSRQNDGLTPSTPASRKRHGIITNGKFNIVKYSIAYLKNLDNIVVDRINLTNRRNCILDESTHLVIVDIAVGLMMNRVKEQRLSNSENLKDLE